MNDGPAEAQRKLMQALERVLDMTLNGDERPGPNGFVLLTFRFGETSGGRVNYVSNGNREDVLTALREFLGRMEGRAHDAPGTVQ
jgi:hypothetical protein